LIEDKTYEEVLKIAEEYNDDLTNDFYISLVTNYTSKPRHTTGLTFKTIQSSFKVNLPNKYKVLGSNAFNCDYLVPWEAK
jgi:hypothetical protein